MKQSSKRLFSTFLALAFIVASLLIFFDLIEPAYGDLETLKGEQLGNQALLANEQSAVAQAKTLLASYQNDTAAEGDLALAMPSGPNIAGALSQIYGIAANNGIAVQTIGVGVPTVNTPSANSAGSSAPSQVVKPLGAISFQLTGSGSYEDLKAFLAQLETNIRIFDLTTLSLQSGNVAPASGKGGAPNPDIFSYSMTIVTYYQLP